MPGIQAALGLGGISDKQPGHGPMPPGVEDEVKIGLYLVAIAIVSVGLLSLREYALKRFGKKADMNAVAKAVVAWILVGVTMLMIVEKMTD
jgi:hypothetical protein